MHLEPKDVEAALELEAEENYRAEIYDKARRRLSVFYASDNDTPAILKLEELISNFRYNAGNAGYSESAELDMIDDLLSRGWHENDNDSGRYLVLNVAKFSGQLEIAAFWR